MQIVNQNKIYYLKEAIVWYAESQIKKSRYIAYNYWEKIHVLRPFLHRWTLSAC